MQHRQHRRLRRHKRHAARVADSERSGKLAYRGGGNGYAVSDSYFASQPWRSVLLDGTPRMRKRPIGELVEALRLCGAEIDYYASEGYPPLWIEGRHLKADAPLRMRGNVSSQYVSAMMMVAPMMKGGLTIEIKAD